MNVETINQGKISTDKLITFIETLVYKFKPMQIYLFSKIVNTNSEDGCFTPQVNKEKVHYFLMMIMESSTRNEHEAQDFCRSKFGYGKITILSHSLETVQESTRKNNRFFISILNNGKLLYDYTGFVKSKNSLPFDPSQNFEKAERHYSHRIRLAQGFLDGAGDSYGNGHYSVAVFLVHQVIEQCTIGLIRVNLAYRSDIHNLGRQLDLCQCFSAKPSEIFRTSNEDLRLFEILLRSYSQARYKDNFKVDQEDADKLVTKAYAFFDLTKKICMDKIEQFKAENAQLKEREVSFE